MDEDLLRQEIMELRVQTIDALQKTIEAVILVQPAVHKIANSLPLGAHHDEVYKDLKELNSRINDALGALGSLISAGDAAGRNNDVE